MFQSSVGATFMCLLSTTVNYFEKEKQNKFQALFMEGNLRSNNALYKTPKHSLFGQTLQGNIIQHNTDTC